MEGKFVSIQGSFIKRPKQNPDPFQCGSDSLYFQAFDNYLPVTKNRGDPSFPCRATLGDEEDRSDPPEPGLHSSFCTCEEPSVLGYSWVRPLGVTKA